MQSAPALEGPRLTDIGSEKKLSNILLDRHKFHTFEEQLRLSMEKVECFSCATRHMQCM